MVAAGLFFGGMGVAVADSEHKFVMTDPGVALVGTYQWQSTSKVPSGLHVKGELKDDDPDDGHNVYLRTRVEGYPWGRIKGVQRKNVKVDEVFFDGAVLKTKEVRLQVCRDRGSLRPDNCSPERLFSRR
ncbi:hypothetical protein AQF52_4230 [Streptomyces venezuelae]|nr:hypothetical protein AQF52_4230 [Streptomyces venezuelae]CUM39741.1 hypothetical protein BN2537_8447 [Streptomyces venezuelae]